ncbi:hypothetical protein CA54_16710 [Symmachiella macrocystis]|uniref:Uncharacterized protein n=1 Tax=Symmachiella macrocystis TaxID=2527985 RepID=A0A5C6BLF6_9PLAN|nr:hypothetical protein CA54_16710 [Symmachiella macrocystis]
MAEIAIKVDDFDGYLDGDTLQGFSRLGIRRVHAENICGVGKMRRTREGLLPTNCLLRKYMQRVRQYRFERVSAGVVLRKDLRSRGRDNAEEMPMDVRQYLRRRLRKADNLIFGLTGREFWYGGSWDFSHSAFDGVWGDIETDSNEREADHTEWPFTPADKREHLVVTVDDMSEPERVELQAPQLGAKGQVISKRCNFVRIADDLGLTGQEVDDVRNKTREVDIRRQRQFTRATFLRVRQ